MVESVASTPEADEPVLCLKDVTAGYNRNVVLHSVNLAVRTGEIVALIGHNGAGKSTLLKVAFGLLLATQGRVLLDGCPIGGLQPDDLLRRGVTYIPQGNRVFGSLTVRENLAIGGHASWRRASLSDAIERACELFPVLRQRLASQASHLSGGERQMLSLANAVMFSPRLLLLDEPSLGLSPEAAVLAFEKIRDINRSLRTTVLVVEQKVRSVLAIADHAVVMRRGNIAYDGPPLGLSDDESFRAAYL